MTKQESLDDRVNLATEAVDRIAVLIRATRIDSQCLNLAAKLQKVFRSRKINIFLDRLHSEIETVAPEIPSYVHVIQMTKENLKKRSLAYIDHRTGWLCGDYSLYYMLDQDWDHILVIEPDMGFINGAEWLLTLLLNANVDLAGINLGPASKSWYWSERLENATDGLEPFAVAFGLIWASRELVEAAYLLRKEISNKVRESSIQCPNDESVIASVAGNSGMSLLNLQDLFPGAFQYFSTTKRYYLPDIEEITRFPQIVHGVVSWDRYQQLFKEEWRKYEETQDKKSHARLYEMFAISTNENKNLLFQSVLKSIAMK